jgi:hypothetical protein
VARARAEAQHVSVRVAVVAIIVLGASLAACGDKKTRPITHSAAPILPTSLPHDCFDRANPPPPIPWEELRNPIYAPDHMVKDQALQGINGEWHLFMSERWDRKEGARFPVVRSTDFKTWSPVESFNGLTLDSPDVTRATDGELVITSQEPGPTGAAQIVYRRQPTIDGPWKESTELLGDPFPGVRMIDGAIAHAPRGLFAIAKRGARDQVPQTPEVFYAESGVPQGPWQHLGTANLGWTENFQFLFIDGVWHVLATTIPIHEPTLFRLDGDPEKPRSRLRWNKVRSFDIPSEEWNSPREGPAKDRAGITYERANSAYLCDARALDGYWYLVYAGSDELSTHDGRGLARIGIARSEDLVHWTVPPN